MKSRRALVIAALSGRRDPAGKLARLARSLVAFVDLRALDARLGRLRDAGVASRIPNRAQLAAGIYDMLRFYVFPSAGEYYDERETSFAFYHLLRFLEEPSSIIDPVGLFTTRDGIIGHLMQVAHDNPQYDLELLQAEPDGIDALERELDAMLAGTHPRAPALRAIIEEPDYHERLRAYVTRWRSDPRATFMREPVNDVERTFATVSAALRYMTRLPDTARGAIRHAREVKTFPLELAERR